MKRHDRSRRVAIIVSEKGRKRDKERASHAQMVDASHPFTLIIEVVPTRIDVVVRHAVTNGDGAIIGTKAQSGAHPPGQPLAITVLQVAASVRFPAVYLRYFLTQRPRPTCCRYGETKAPVRDCIPTSRPRHDGVLSTAVAYEKRAKDAN